MNEKITTIGGKAYKECMVVMLPTKDKTPIAKHTKTRNIEWFVKDNLNKIEGGFYEHQYLYILSNEEIKEGDWFHHLEFNKIHQYTAKGGEVALKALNSNPNLKKIIATTDKNVNNNTHLMGKISGEYPLPRPSDDFLKAYCKANGKIDKVYVEYVSKSIQVYPRSGRDFQGNERYEDVINLKVAPDNTITIKPIQLSIEEAAMSFNPDVDNPLDWIKGFKAGAEWRDNNPK